MAGDGAGKGKARATRESSLCLVEYSVQCPMRSHTQRRVRDCSSMDYMGIFTHIAHLLHISCTPYLTGRGSTIVHAERRDTCTRCTGTVQYMQQYTLRYIKQTVVAPPGLRAAAAMCISNPSTKSGGGEYYTKHYSSSSPRRTFPLRIQLNPIVR